MSYEHYTAHAMVNTFIDVNLFPSAKFLTGTSDMTQMKSARGRGYVRSVRTKQRSQQA